MHIKTKCKQFVRETVHSSRKKIKTDRKVKHTNYENFQKQILYLLPLLYMQIPSQEDKNIKHLSRIIAIFF